MEQYHVRLTSADLVFSAAHFITYHGEGCERLHGHNYRVGAEVHGPLDENHYVVDFLLVREALGELLGEWDHAVLLPTQHPQIRLLIGEQEVEARFQDRRWVFPRDDCRLVPVANTTAELLAAHLGQRLRELLEARSGCRPAQIQMELDEGLGQTAVWRWSRP